MFVLLHNTFFAGWANSPLHHLTPFKFQSYFIHNTHWIKREKEKENGFHSWRCSAHAISLNLSFFFCCCCCRRHQIFFIWCFNIWWLYNCLPECLPACLYYYVLKKKFGICNFVTIVILLAFMPWWWFYFILAGLVVKLNIHFFAYNVEIREDLFFSVWFWFDFLSITYKPVGKDIKVGSQI